MENQKLQRAIENYTFGMTDYELYWELAFSPPCDIEAMTEQAWTLSCKRNLPIPVVALACRLCLETSTNAQRLQEALTFLRAHSDYGDDANLRIVAQRLKIPLDSTHLDER